MSDGLRGTVTVLQRGQNTGISCTVELEGNARDLTRTLLEALELPPDAPCTLTDIASGRVLAAEEVLRELSPPCTQLVLNVDCDQDIALQESVPAKCLSHRPCFALCVVDLFVRFFFSHPSFSLSLDIVEKDPNEETKESGSSRSTESETETLADISKASAAAVGARSEGRATQNALALVQSQRTKLGMKVAKTAAGAVLPGGVTMFFDSAVRAAQVSLFDDYAANLPYGVHAGRPCVAQVCAVLQHYARHSGVSLSSTGMIAFDPFRLALARGNVLASSVDDAGSLGTYHLTFDELAGGVWYAFVAAAEARAQPSDWVPVHSRRRSCSGTAVLETRLLLAAATRAGQTTRDANRTLGAASFVVRRRTYRLAAGTSRVRVAVLHVDRAQLAQRHAAALDAALARLREMGFVDADRNTRLLRHYNGDIARVLEHLAANRPTPRDPVGFVPRKQLA